MKLTCKPLDESTHSLSLVSIIYQFSSPIADYVCDGQCANFQDNCEGENFYPLFALLWELPWCNRSYKIRLSLSFLILTHIYFYYYLSRSLSFFFSPTSLVYLPLFDSLSSSSLHYTLSPPQTIKFLTARFVVLFGLRNVWEQRRARLSPALPSWEIITEGYPPTSLTLPHLFSLFLSLRLRTGLVSEGMRQASSSVRSRWFREKLCCNTTTLRGLSLSLSYRCQPFFTGQFSITVDQFSGADVAMGEHGDNACVECLAMKCVGAEHLQWRAPFHYL